MVKICKICDATDEDNSWFSNYYTCEDCEQILRLSKIYGISNLRQTLDNIYVRDKTPIENRTKKIKEEETYILRCKKKKEEKTTL